MMKKTTLSVATLALALAISAQAADTNRRVPHFKTGECTITLLDADGIQPLAGADLTLTDAQTGETLLTTEASKSGVCKINIANGRFVLGIDGRDITVVDASEQGVMDWARIVVTESPMMVGGQTGAEVSTFTFMGLSGQAAVSAAVAAGVITVGAGGAIIYNETDDDDDTPTPDPEPPAPVTAPTRPTPTPASP